MHHSCLNLFVPSFPAIRHPNLPLLIRSTWVAVSFGTLKEKKYAPYSICIMAATTVTYFYIILSHTTHKKFGVFDYRVQFM